MMAGTGVAARRPAELPPTALGGTRQNDLSEGFELCHFGTGSFGQLGLTALHGDVVRVHTSTDRHVKGGDQALL